ncbi:Crp/Fnr family transcriptional regulator [Caulobacter segnis]|uniref:Transcriptional regulator n=1 Tax=Caulobacter segnis TaxID=88688 RepID=A0A2W5V8D1_9CAUL|nr:Crp/Fnr family transcriptional regulator [Caulobacter segnis]PZR34153.1 MAG: transcriptional regulator [Caulobacter segnis]
MKTFSPSLAPSPSHTPKEASPKDYRANRVFRHMSHPEVEALGGVIETLTYGKGEMILQRHDREGGIYLLLDGVLLANQYAKSGREVGYRRITAGSYFGEISAIDGLPRSVNIVALEDSRLARLPQSLVRRLFEESPRFMKALLEDMAGLARSLTDRLFELTAVSVACRVDIELLRMASAASTDGRQAVINPCPTHAELATLLGSQREPVTRELNRLAGLGIVRQTGRTLHVLDLPALADEVERIGGEV